jgi:Zn-dependent protease
MGLDLSPEIVRQAILDMLIFLISLTLHEWGHAKVADMLGDPTPRGEGRVTLNPLPHIDPLGTLIIPILGALHLFGGLGLIGWAKPVYINPSHFRNRNRDAALVTIAGPAMNFLIALIAVVIAAGLYRVSPKIIELASLIAAINVILIIFNLLPFPPLDGSKFLMYWFGMSEETYMRYSQWGGFLLLALCFTRPFQVFLAYLEALGMSFFDIVFHVLAR